MLFLLHTLEKASDLFKLLTQETGVGVQAFGFQTRRHHWCPHSVMMT